MLFEYRNLRQGSIRFDLFFIRIQNIYRLLDYPAPLGRRLASLLSYDLHTFYVVQLITIIILCQFIHTYADAYARARYNFD